MENLPALSGLGMTMREIVDRRDYQVIGAAGFQPQDFKGTKYEKGAPGVHHILIDIEPSEYRDQFRLRENLNPKGRSLDDAVCVHKAFHDARSVFDMVTAGPLGLIKDHAKGTNRVDLTALKKAYPDQFKAEAPPKPLHRVEDVAIPGGTNVELKQRLIQATTDDGKTAVLQLADGEITGLVAKGGQGETRGVKVMPSFLGEPETYADTAENFEEAVQQRGYAKRTTCVDQQAINDVKGLARLMCHNDRPETVVFSEQNVRNWLANNFDAELTRCKASSWSAQRVMNAVREYHSKAWGPQGKVRMAGAVKGEGYAPGKPPRALVAWGDHGQVISLLTMGAIEGCLFAHFRDQSIKHKSKRDAMHAMAKHLNVDSDVLTQLLEGDGSAWDFTVSGPVREAEKIIIEHVGSIICSMFPEFWAAIDERAHADEKGYIKVMLKKSSEKGSKPKEVWIPDMRSSGDRGTSVLNWIVNFLMWATILTCHFREFLNPTSAHVVKCRDGVKRTVKFAFEGDDSALAFSPPLSERFAVEVEAKWAARGFRMKLIDASAKGRLEFTGCLFEVGPHGATGRWTPDVVRALKNGPYSFSPALMETCASANTVRPARDIAAAKAMAYANNFSSCCPFLAGRYLQYSKEVGHAARGLKADADTVFSLAGVKRVEDMSLSVKEQYSQIELAIASTGITSIEDELAIMAKCGNDMATMMDIKDRVYSTAEWNPDLVF
ncbi:putative RNA-dependent RNA polymerase [Freshwater macrophyte associated wei-like virus 1]|nr:putative RNA-dependent RNA polymerase [Freshwater macrophyte associated wei-like virus 1]